MNIYDNLTELDKSMIMKWINLFADGCNSVNEPALRHILRYWTGEKEHIYHIFGDNFILEKEITYEKDFEDLYQDFHKLLYESDYSEKKLTPVIKEIFKDLSKENKNNSTWDSYDTFHRLLSSEVLAKNSYYFSDSQIIVGEKCIKVQKGTKPMRILKKIFHFYGYDDVFEEFRIKHSMILNEKIFKGTMCLSIHPLDYMTMSDNECKWHSCMNWREEGSYRRGTVEMMNSPMAIVAYLKSSTPMKFDKYEWNSKKWRELILYNQGEFICGVKGYPMWNRNLEEIAVDWMKDLVKDAKWGETSYIFPWEYTLYENKYTINFKPETNTMYNDFNEEEGHQGCFDFNFLECFNQNEKIPVYFNYSGRVVCMNCGESDFIDDDSYQEQLCCDSCSNSVICENCGGHLYGNDIYYEVDGEYLCEDCFETETEVDSFTDESHLRENMAELLIWDKEMNTYNDESPLNVYNDRYEINNNIKDIFGRNVHLYKGYYWGRGYYLININELDELAIERLMKMVNYTSLNRFKEDFISVPEQTRIVLS